MLQIVSGVVVSPTNAKCHEALVCIFYLELSVNYENSFYSDIILRSSNFFGERQAYWFYCSAHDRANDSYF